MIPIKDTVRRMTNPSVTWTLIAVNTIIFIFESTLPESRLANVSYLFGLVPARYTRPEWAFSNHLFFDYYFSFFSNMFLHGGWFHLIGNMWFLCLFGRSVEDRTGHARFLALYLLCGLAASLTYFLVYPRATVPVLGASGAIAGVMGAYLVLFPRAKIVTLLFIPFLPLFVDLSAFVYLLYWLALQVISWALSLSSPETGGGVAWWGHVGGFVTGAVLVFFLRSEKLRRRKDYPDEKYRYITD
jgi:membrane associated rhomboid family serine protease